MREVGAGNTAMGAVRGTIALAKCPLPARAANRRGAGSDVGWLHHDPAFAAIHFDKENFLPVLFLDHTDHARLGRGQILVTEEILVLTPDLTPP